MIRNYYARSDHFRYSFESEDILEDAAAEGQDPLEIISRNEVTGFIERQFRCLPEEMRKTLALVAEQNHSYEEAAAAMGIPIGTVRSRIFRARAYLKEWGSMDMLTT
jgi:RNA polymerase sigma-70 factor (ECF subfamily)